MTLEDDINSLPSSPGVYIMKGEREILYIGKAKNIKARVKSYFSKHDGNGRYAVRYLAGRVRRLEYIVTANEKEALILEDVLLKKHKPRYNIRLKDDKTYVSIKLTVQEKFPRISIVRRIKDDGARYFGPYASSRDVRDVVKFLRKLFPLCSCSLHEFRNRVRPCLDYQIGVCSAPCVSLISEASYAELVSEAVLFLDGRNREVLGRLKKKMLEASCREDYAEAAKWRDRAVAIEGMLLEQKVVGRPGIDSDVFGFLRQNGDVVIQMLFVRDGRITGSRDFSFRKVELPSEEVMSSFLSQLYAAGRFIPEEVLLPFPVNDGKALASFLSDKKAGVPIRRMGRAVKVYVPKRGRKMRLVLMAKENAEAALKRLLLKEKEMPQGLNELKARLRLPNLPSVIEAFDISNLEGDMAIGAMVVFVNAVPDKSRYRLYKIRLTEGPNDYAMMHETLSRRYKDSSAQPDLILVDGGKGQLSIALKVLDGIGANTPVAAIAKEKLIQRPGGKVISKGERVYLKGAKDAVFLKEGSSGDLLLRRIRDEAHRFAISRHRRLRSGAFTSILETIPGVGPKKRLALFETFGDLEGVKNASVHELTLVPGITENLANNIKKELSL
ncbi:MAG: excinuclease ABC subunit UvrC [Thermodesulfobacteriota bacterium]